jgi:hypothetical protein
VCIKHIFLIYLSVMCHLGFFKSSAILNSATVNMGVLVILWYPTVHAFGCLLDHMTVCSLVFWGTSILLSIMFALLYIPTNSMWVCFSSHSSPAFFIVCVIDGSHFDCSEVDSQCYFDLHFLYGQGSFWMLSVQFICPFTHWVVDILWD